MEWHWTRRIKRWNAESKLGSLSNLIKECLYLLAFGVSMAFLTLFIEYISSKLLTGRLVSYNKVKDMIPANYFVWISFPIIVILLSATYTRLISSKAIGSGIPEMMILIKGFLMDGYLSFLTLLAKVGGIILATGSGIPVGREGPFIHIACIVGILLDNMFHCLIKRDRDDLRKIELLITGFGVGLACCFSSPIGGVLFSMEITASYFAVRNYWRGFFTAITSVTIIKIFNILIYGQEFVTVYFKSWFPYSFLLKPQEILLFMLLGLFSGLIGSLFIYLIKWLNIGLQANNRFVKFLTDRWWLYTVLITFSVATLSYPGGVGKFYLSQLSQTEKIKYLFYNVTSSRDSYQPNYLPASNDIQFGTKINNFLVTSSITILHMIFTLFIVTMPIPCGLIIPSFVIGSAFGRLFGDAVMTIAPNYHIDQYPSADVFSGVYSMMGAAAVGGSMSRTVSTAVIVFEMTGQNAHLLPTLIATLTANGISHLLGPSIYDIILMLRKVTYLPELLGIYPKLKNYCAGDIMERDVKYIDSQSSTYDSLLQLVQANPDFLEFPIVENSRELDFYRAIYFRGYEKALELNLSAKYNDRSADYYIQEICFNFISEYMILKGSICREGVERMVSDYLSKRKKASDKLSPKGSFNGTLHKLLHIKSIKSLRAPVDDDSISKGTDASVDWDKWMPKFSTTIQVLPNTPLKEIHYIFTYLNLSHVYVTSRGRLEGVVSVSDMIRHLKLI